MWITTRLQKPVFRQHVVINSNSSQKAQSGRHNFYGLLATCSRILGLTLRHALSDLPQLIRRPAQAEVGSRGRGGSSPPPDQ